MKLRLLAISTLLAGLHAATAADITGRVTLNGTPPDELVNAAIAADPSCGKLHPEAVKTQFYVVGPNKELKDVVVYLTGIKGKSTGATAPPFVLDQKGCMYTPYIFAVQTGQKILVRNSDPVAHNVLTSPTVAGNESKNLPQAEGGSDLPMSFANAEDFLKFQCNNHLWMFAYATVVDHPYFAVTGADGKFTLKDVPPGKYTVQAAHRKASAAPAKPVTKEIEVKDGNVSLDFVLDAPK